MTSVANGLDAPRWRCYSLMYKFRDYRCSDRIFGERFPASQEAVLDVHLERRKICVAAVRMEFSIAWIDSDLSVFAVAE